jgi:hypothetical protein
MKSIPCVSKHQLLTTEEPFHKMQKVCRINQNDSLPCAFRESKIFSTWQTCIQYQPAVYKLHFMIWTWSQCDLTRRCTWYIISGSNDLGHKSMSRSWNHSTQLIRTSFSSNVLEQINKDIKSSMTKTQKLSSPYTVFHYCHSITQQSRRKEKHKLEEEKRRYIRPCCPNWN